VPDGLFVMEASGDGDVSAQVKTAGAAKRRPVRLTQVKSAIGESPRHRGTLRALGLGRIGKTAEQDGDSPVIAGMLRKVAHLVKVEDA
jgi:large subunit ribosomal protein L30